MISFLRSRCTTSTCAMLQAIDTERLSLTCRSAPLPCHHCPVCRHTHARGHLTPAYARSLTCACTTAQWFMDEIPFRGHWHPELGYPIRVSCAPGECGPPYHWQLGGQSGEQLHALVKRAAPLSPTMPAPGVRPTASYVEPLVALLDNVIMQLQPRPTHIVIGAPWPGDINGATWMSMARFAELLAAGNRIMSRSSGNAIRFVWKTDTQPAPCSLGALSRKVMEPHVAQYRELVQRNPLWGLFDLWNATAAFGNECYEDTIHFNEIARTHFNALLLRDLFKKSK